MKKRTIRFAAICLTIALLLSVVAALSFDLDGDGRTDIWDLQLAINQGKSSQELVAALDEAMSGKGDELHKNAQGQWEIWSSVGMFNMAKIAKMVETFVMLQDVDMGGIQWNTVATFTGVLEGNGYTVSNFTIAGSANCDDGANVGLFGMIDHAGTDANGTVIQSRVQNLHLEDVTMVLPDDGGKSYYAGVIAGTNRGIVENCTVDCIVQDARTSLSQPSYIGALVGRNSNSTPPGKIVKGTDLLTVTAGTPNPEDKVEGISARMALDVAELSEGSKKREVGITGYTKETNIDTTMIWQDTTNDSSRLSEAEQQKRQTVVDKMYQMGTVAWTPSEQLTFTNEGSATTLHSNIYIPGRTYYGIPYVGGYNGSYERFLSVMQTEKDAEGRYVTVTGLENGTKDSTVTGFSRYMGNNCSVAIGWAWAAVSPSRVANDDGAIYGGAQILAAYYLVPNENNTSKYGVLPVGGYTTLTSDTTKFEEGLDARDTQSLIWLESNGYQNIAKAYTQAHKGDAITYANYSWGVYEYKSSHCRLLAADPMIIRNYGSSVVLEKSYVITHEQGDGLLDNRNADGSYEKVDGYNVKTSSWRINHKYTLDVLITPTGYENAKAAAVTDPSLDLGSGWGYIPVTMRAFSTNSSSKAPYYSEYPNHKIQLPNTGWYYTNYWTISGEMIIKDAAGNEVYHETSYLLDRYQSSGYNTIKLENDFPTATDNLVAGQEYTLTLRFTASNGTVTTVKNNVKFTYTVAE